MANVVAVDRIPSQYAMDLGPGENGRKIRLGSKSLLMALLWFPVDPRRKESVTYSSTVGDNRLQIKVSAGPKYGYPTHFDKNIIIYAMSQFARSIQDLKGSRPQNYDRIRITASEYFKHLGVEPSGQAYDRFREGISRLSEAWIETNLTEGDENEMHSFHWASDLRVFSKNSTGRITKFSFKMPDFVRNLVENNPDLIAYHPDHFKIKSPMAQRMQELCYLHFSSEIFSIDMLFLMERTGFGHITPGEFKQNFLKLLRRNPKGLLPGFAVYFYSKTRPSGSIDWNTRVLAKNAVFVFVREEEQREQLDIPLGEITPYLAVMSEGETELLNTVKQQGELT